MTLSARLISGKWLPAEEEDIDVARERRRVYEGEAHSDLLRICDLTKVSSFGALYIFSGVFSILFLLVLDLILFHRLFVKSVIVFNPHLTNWGLYFFLFVISEVLFFLNCSNILSLLSVSLFPTRLPRHGGYVFSVCMSLFCLKT